MLPLVVVVLACASSRILAEESLGLGRARDSYLDAFKATHSLNAHTAKIERDFQFPEQPHPVYNKPQEEYGAPHEGYGPPKDTYGPPKDTYGPPKDVYGPPKDVYGPPKDVYGPPQNSYPPPQPAYGPPSYVPPSPVYGPPMEFHGYTLPNSLLMGLLDKFKFKLDLFTLGKIVLKLVIFKKIVSLIAILCLLLFIPSLKKHHNKDEDQDEDDEMRSFNSKTVDDRLNNITAFVTESIEEFAKKQHNAEKAAAAAAHCDSIYCKGESVLNYVNKKFTYKKLLNMYAKEG